MVHGAGRSVVGTAGHALACLVALPRPEGVAARDGTGAGVPVQRAARHQVVDTFSRSSTVQ